MPRPWRPAISRRETSAARVTWTFETFGPKQAAVYEVDLLARCKEIASGTAWSQDCRRIIDPNLPEDLRFTRAGQHFVVFVEDAEQVIFVDFLHGRSDLPRRLAALTQPKLDRDH